jgi:HD-like signal output (HDOD) protein
MDPVKNETGHSDKFEFVQKLAADLTKGDIELPSFPDIVMRVRQALEDEDCTTEKLVQLIGAEPVLAARLLSISNSAALKPAGDPITNLNMAVNRIGRIMVRNSAMSFALTQMRNARKLESIKTLLGNLWEQCAHVAALCYVLTKKYTKLNADEAMFVGLMHGIGKMYILVSAEDFPTIFGNEADMREIMDQWDTGIGSSIIETWGFPEHVSAAVRDYKDTARDHENSVDYTDILILAYLMFRFINSEDDSEFLLDDIPASHKLDINAADMIGVLSESQEQIRSLRRALGK